MPHGHGQGGLSRSSTSDIFGDVISQDPRAAFFGKLGQASLGPGQRNYFQGQFGNIYNEYLGSLYNQAQQGFQAAPTVASPTVAEGLDQPSFGLGFTGSARQSLPFNPLPFSDFLSGLDFTERYLQTPFELRGQFGGGGVQAPRLRYGF